MRLKNILKRISSPETMKIVVLGSTGMLGQAIVKEARSRKIKTYELSRRSKEYPLDLTNDRLLESTLKHIHPDIIINAAAIVNIDFCEQNPGLAYLTNARLVSKVINISHELNSYFVQISTDHFYTGDKNRKHKEIESITIVNEYARTKYAGETFALISNKTLVLRTNILGFRNTLDNPTFIEWVIRSLTNTLPMVLFSDYFISGIHVVQLASILFDVISKRPYGVLNLASRDVYSKKELIELLAQKLKLSLKNTKNGSVFQNMNVMRAESLGLDNTKAESILGYHLPDLGEVVSSIIKEYTMKYR